MRIESIEIRNFRQYREVKFDFKRKANKKDIHIVVGETGEGKTNILNAITWCLYQEEMHLGNKSAAIDRINSQYVQELRKLGKKKGELQVIVEISSEEEKASWKIMRTEEYSINDTDVMNIGNEPIITEISRKGSKVIENPDDINAIIQRYVPKEINEYIFFDGEHLDDYFKEEKKQNIENGIKDLTQASIVKKAIDSLDKYLKTEINPLLKNSGDNAVSEAQEIVDEKSTLLEQQQATIFELEEQIRIHKANIASYTERIRGHENLQDQAIRLEELEKESDTLAKKERDNYTNMMKFVREYYTLLSLYPSMKSFANYIQKQSDAGNLPPKIDRKLVEAMIKENKCLICDQPLDEKHLEGIKNLLKRLEVSSDTSAELNRASSALAAYFEKVSEYKSRKETFVIAHQSIQADINKNEEEYSKLSEYMHNIPDSEQIKEAITNREYETTTLEAQIEKLGREKVLYERTSKQLDDAQKELDKAMEANHLLTKFKRQKDFCKKSMDILTETMNEVLCDCRTDMQDATFKIFERLMWKKNAFKRIEIKEDYSFILEDIYGNQTLGSCSAAERALLALSFTLALQDISGHDSLLYIDTPVGRVGAKSRKTFVDVLKDISDSKQVILTFTPSEYDTKVQEGLYNAFSTYCELKYDDGITTITNIH